MKTYLLLSIVSVLASPTWAAKIADPKCNDIITINDKFTPQYVAVIDGYDKNNKKLGEEIDVGGITKESSPLKQACQNQKTKSIKDVRKNVATTAAASTSPAASTSLPPKINPVNATCEDFIALGEDYQPVAAFWVAGHNKSGKVIKKGEVTEEFLETPVLTLVEECRKNPKASFYSQAKTWFEKRL